MRALRLLIQNLSKHIQPAKFEIKGIKNDLNIDTQTKNLYTVD